MLVHRGQDPRRPRHPIAIGAGKPHRIELRAGTLEQWQRYILGARRTALFGFSALVRAHEVRADVLRTVGELLFASSNALPAPVPCGDPSR